MLTSTKSLYSDTFDSFKASYPSFKGNVKPNGEPYYYTEGSMPFPDNLDAPARTMLTSEGGINNTSPIIL